MTRPRLIAEAAIALVLFGCIPVVVKSIAANPFTIGIFRLTVAMAGLLLIAVLRKRLVALGGRDVARLALIGLLFFGHWITYFFAIKTSSASIGAIGLSTYGIHLLILSAMFGRARLRALDVLAVTIAIAGAVMVLPSFDVRNDVTGGMLLAIFSAVMYASLPILHQRWSHLSSSVRALGQFTFAWLLFLMFLPKSDWTLAPRDWGGLVFLAVGSTLVGHTLWVRVTTELSSPVTSVIYYANVPFAVALGVIFLGEPLTTRTLIGGAMVIVGSLTGMLNQRALAMRAASEALQ